MVLGLFQTCEATTDDDCQTSASKYTITHDKDGVTAGTVAHIYVANTLTTYDAFSSATELSTKKIANDADGDTWIGTTTGLHNAAHGTISTVTGLTKYYATTTIWKIQPEEKVVKD